MMLCPEEAAGPMSAWERLKEFAATRGMLFLGNRQLHAEGDSVELLHRLWRRKQPLLPTLSWSADPPDSPRHLGINE